MLAGPKVFIGLYWDICGGKITGEPSHQHDLLSGGKTSKKMREEKIDITKSFGQKTWTYQSSPSSHFHSSLKSIKDKTDTYFITICYFGDLYI